MTHDPRPPHYEDGRPVLRYLDMTPETVTELGYPNHPCGRYVSLTDAVFHLLSDNREQAERLFFKLLGAVAAAPPAPAPAPAPETDEDLAHRKREAAFDYRFAQGLAETSDEPRDAEGLPDAGRVEPDERAAPHVFLVVDADDDEGCLGVFWTFQEAVEFADSVYLSGLTIQRYRLGVDYTMPPNQPVFYQRIEGEIPTWTREP